MPDRTKQRTSRRRTSRAPTKLWQGRLSGTTSAVVEEYTTSLPIDRRLAAEDVEGSVAHARMLRDTGILKPIEHRAIERGLRTIAAEIGAGEFAFSPTDEDIHTAVERRLHELIGTVAGKLHTARSRNDQVATDLRLWTKRACDQLMRLIADLQDALIDRAREHRTSVMPGNTHGQRAQVVSLAHHLLAYVEMLQRDVERVAGARDRADVLPLGSGALAASTIPIDRHALRRSLGFAAISANSMDAVSDRDFAVELIAACALLMVHLSRLGEELVMWSTVEYGFVEFPDTHATGSSLMPQKKNPDVAELVRGRSGRVIGDLVTMLAVLKGLPLSYNRDLQEDKEAVFDAVDTSASTLRVLAELVSAVHFDQAAMRAAATDPSMMATDVAEFLVQRGVPFREAHTIVSGVVARTVRERRTLSDVDLKEWRAASDKFDAGITSLFDVDRALRRRDVLGGPGPNSIARQLRRASGLVAQTRRATQPQRIG
jgi:argininosuccinate lyase